MVAYILRRLLGILPVLLIGLTFTFFIIHLAPGDPTTRFMDPSMDPALKEKIAERFGLNDPLHFQYFLWLKQVIFHFDFGNSFNSGRSASVIVFDALIPTILVTGLSLLFGLILGVLGGIFSAINHGNRVDKIITSVMLFFFSMPAFWLGMMLLGLFSIKLDWLPSSQLTSIFHDQLNIFGRISDYAKHLILPVLALGLSSTATFGRFIRSSMIEAMGSDYVTAAEARGISRGRIIIHYGFRNALIPLVTLIGFTIPVLFSGAVVIEVIFSLPGMGRVMVNAVLGRDYPVILAASTCAFLSVLAGNLLADIFYGIVDPRIQVYREVK
ncbi:MAG: ABC transporter permease [Candidatus Marinimicrobia bacterium]|nr:ABC transporter permease [Candidatus Neomarinimicrobiota bacterium]